MKIGFDAKRAFSNNTGLGNYSRDTFGLLSYYASKNQYFIYTPKIIKNPRLNFISNKKNIHLCTPKSLVNQIFKIYWRSRGIVKELLNDEINIYHGLSNELPIGIEKTNIKTIVTIHDLIFMRYPKFFKDIDRNVYIKKFKSACQRANKIIAVSKQTKKDIISFFNIPEEKIKVVYQGCNKVFQSKIKKEDKILTISKYKLPKEYLLYVGTIEERKNLLTILKTLKELPDQTLVVIGNGKSYKKKCQKFIIKNKLSERVIFLNNLSTKEIAIIYQSAEIMIYPSIFEGFGIPILEALFSKTPVITSKGGCFLEAGGSYSKYINPLSPSEMKEAIIKIQNSESTKNEMIEKGFEHAKKFTNDKIAKNLIEVYTNL